MKTNKRFMFTTVILLAAYVLSACNGVLPQAEKPSDDHAVLKVQAMEVAYTGVIEAINGNEWTIDGQVLTVDPSVVRDGPFQVGDTVKVEGNVNSDGTITVKTVEMPTAADLSGLPQFGDAITNDNGSTNDSNTNDAASTNSNDANSNDDNSNSAGKSGSDVLSSDDEIYGVVESFDGTTLVVDGQEYTVADFSEIKGEIVAGDNVKIEFMVNEDGTLTIKEVKLSDDGNGNSNTNLNGNTNDDDEDDDDDSNSNGNSNDDDDDDEEDDDDHNGNSNTNTNTGTGTNTNTGTTTTP